MLDATQKQVIQYVPEYGVNMVSSGIIVQKDVVKKQARPRQALHARGNALHLRSAKIPKRPSTQC